MTSQPTGGEFEEPMVPAFDQARVVVLAGSGIVARFPGIVAVFADDSDLEDAHLEQFLAICDEASRAGSRAPGRRLARQLSVWLGGMDDIPCLATVAATDGSVAVFLTGAARLHVGGVGPDLSGADSAAWLDRVVDWPASPFTLSVGPSTQLAASLRLNLQLGVVNGAAVTIVPSPFSAEPAPSQAEQWSRPPLPEPAPVSFPAAPEPAVEDVVLSAPAQPVELPPLPPMTPPPSHSSKQPLAPPARSALIAGFDNPEPPRAPLPIPGSAEDVVPAAGTDAAQVQGFLCSRGHLNDPRALFCGLCGIRMAERTGILTIGRRPPLGLLVFDDGATFTVDSGYLLGRDPESDERVKHGGLRPLVVIDTRGAVSRRHAALELDGWTVLLADVGSANGTFVAERGSDTWSALVPQRPIPLRTGTRIRIGTRTFVFESPHGST